MVEGDKQGDLLLIEFFSFFFITFYFYLFLSKSWNDEQQLKKGLTLAKVISWDTCLHFFRYKFFLFLKSPDYVRISRNLVFGNIASLSRILLHQCLSTVLGSVDDRSMVIGWSMHYAFWRPLRRSVSANRHLKRICPDYETGGFLFHDNASRYFSVIVSRFFFPENPRQPFAVLSGPGASWQFFVFKIKFFFKGEYAFWGYRSSSKQCGRQFPGNSINVVIMHV